MRKVTTVAASNVGKVRGNNEDNFFMNGETLFSEGTETIFSTNETDKDGLYAVCDGMGGEDHGEVASAMAVDTMRMLYDQIKESDETIDDLIDRFTREAN